MAHAAPSAARNPRWTKEELVGACKFSRMHAFLLAALKFCMVAARYTNTFTLDNTLEHTGILARSDAMPGTSSSALRYYTGGTLMLLREADHCLSSISTTTRQMTRCCLKAIWIHDAFRVSLKKKIIPIPPIYLKLRM